MEIQEALKFAQERLEQISYNLEMTNSLPRSSFYVKKQEMLIRAVAALRIQAEKEKGCEYCMSEKMFGAVSFPPTTGGKVNIRQMEAVEANYCPVCGRKLAK